MSLASGTQLGPYETVALLGAGGMGEVYKARDTRLHRTVAIKVLPAHVAHDPEARERFEREARAVAALNHPHICTLHDIGEAATVESNEPTRFLVMEFVEGATIAAVGDRPMAAERVADIGAQVCDALDAAHAVGIVHRDIKPLNIMLTPRGQVKVLDFGVAKLASRVNPDWADSAQPTAAAKHTRTGLVMGTLAYMSPEQLCGDPVSGASDIFSLGVALYELITGRHPFALVEERGHMQAMARALLTHAPLPPHHVNPSVPSAFEDVIMRMLSKDPAQRPSASDARTALLDPSSRVSGDSSRLQTRRAARHTVGRRRERTVIEQAFADAAAGRPLLLAVAGEPGIGKTTIVEEFLEPLRYDGRAFVARGRCSERLAGSDAYLPVFEMLEGILVRDERYLGGQPLMADLAPTWYGQVAPGGRGAGTGVGAQLELKNASQERMKREFRAFLDGMCRIKPLVIFFDDVHWADASTTDLLGYLCSQFASMRLLIIVTYRPTDLLLAKHPLAALKLDLAARGLCRELALGFLTRDEAQRYLDLECPGHDFPMALGDVIHEKTEGSPLFMVDLVRDLRDRQMIVAAGSGWTLAQSVPAIERDLPASVRSMIERKISQLSDEDRQLLVAASVQGAEFDSAVVAKALGRDPADVEERLELLGRVHAFITIRSEESLPDGTPTLKCRFVHVLYQNELYASLRASRRASLSAAVANAMIGFHGEKNTAIASELALLFDAARDAGRAAAYFLVAAQNAVAIFAFVEASAIAQRGLALLAKVPESRDRDTIELQLQIALGTAAVAIRGYASPEVERAYGRARELCRRMGDSADLASVLFGLHVYYVVAPSFKTSLELGDETLLIAERDDNIRLRVQGHLIHGMTRFWLGDVAESVAHCEKGIALYDEQRRSISGRTPLFDHGVGCRRYAAVSLWLQGYPDRAARRAEEAIAGARAIKQPLTLASTLGFVSMMHHFRRDAETTRRMSEEAVSCTREYVLTYWLGFARTLYGWSIAHLAGGLDNETWTKGVAAIRESLDAHREAGARTFSPIAWALLADTFLAHELFTDAETAVHEGLALLAQTDECVWEAELRRLRGEIARARGAVGDARRHFDSAVAVAREKGQKSLELRSLMSLYRLEPSVDVRAELEGTYEWFSEGFDTADLRDARALLASGSFG